jgi:IclR family transcriptional regulator, acetate operon repressor
MANPAADYRSSTLAKGLGLLGTILRDNARSSLTQIARAAAIPLPTAHRLALTMEAEGYLTRVSKGYYKPGPAVEALTESLAPVDPVAARLRRPLARLAYDSRAFVHYGVLEDAMVTYLVKEPDGSQGLFTAEEMQLEAYCSAIGKILLAALPSGELDAYLAAGPFIALTANTITDPERLRAEIARVRGESLGYDRGEIREDLFCVAIPVGDFATGVRGAISLSFVGDLPDGERQAQLVARARRIAAGALRAPTASIQM